ncbi:hypothetical protein, partial [Paraburkholderia ginsengiterrae]|uniref:hypothetical protein n=1 Tax=Paraburkholderia ginsengiterrae TaxID=1462993 RepID=UPI001ABEEE33
MLFLHRDRFKEFDDPLVHRFGHTPLPTNAIRFHRQVPSHALLPLLAHIRSSSATDRAPTSQFSPSPP